MNKIYIILTYPGGQLEPYELLNDDIFYTDKETAENACRTVSNNLGCYCEVVELKKAKI